MRISFFLQQDCLLSASAAAIAAGAFCAFITARYAWRFGLVDRPGDRSSHRIPTPKGGGSGILLAFIFTSLCLNLSPLFWGPAVLLSMVSYAGDRIHISPVFRLIVQLAAAFTVLWSISTPLLDGAGFSASEEVQVFSAGCAVLAGVVYIAGTANFYNFMDGINGMAAITGITGFSLMAVHGVWTGDDIAMAVLAVSTACACLGFLPFNVPSARCFMGDVGSILLGFLFGVMVLSEADSLVEAAVLCSFIFPFYADELITMVERIRDGERLTAPHRRHLYQVMANEAGVPHWKISTGYGVFQLITGISVWSASAVGSVWVFPLLLFYTLFFLLVNNSIKAKYNTAADRR